MIDRSHIKSLGGDVQMAQQDGCYTAGLKAVGLGTNKDMTETPKARPTGGRTSSTIVFPPQSPYRAVTVDRYGGRDWPHNAQPRDTCDMTPPPPTPSTLGVNGCKATQRAAPTVTDTPNTTTSGEIMDVQNIRNGEKFDKYYHKNLVSNIFVKYIYPANPLAL